MKTQTNPISLLLGAYRSEVLAILLLRPDESFYVREIARLTGVPAGSLHRELKILLGAGLLLREQLGNQVRYRANRSHPIYTELAAIFRKTSGLAGVLREALVPLQREIDMAFVFGSIAQGSERATSDIDVFVVGRAGFADVVKALAPTRSRLGREVNSVVMSKQEVQEKLRANDRFLSRIAGEPKIFVIGTEDDFSELGDDRAA